MNQKTFSLSATTRSTDHRHSAREVRTANRVPAVMYGPNTKPVSISLDNSDILRTYRQAGRSNLIDLDLDGKKTKVLIHRLEIHPVKTSINHVDFYAVDLTKETNVYVPVIFIGEAPAIKNFGGILIKEYEELEIRCLPTEIPSSIEIDISELENIHDHICLKDIQLDESKHQVQHMSEETILCNITAPRLAEEETTATEEIEGEEGVEGEEGAEGEEGDKKEDSDGKSE